MKKSTSFALALSTVLAVAAARGGEESSGNPITVQLENLDGPKARLELSGEASYLPDGTLLHVSLMVADRHPPVEAGFFRVNVSGGKYGGHHEWDRKTFAPMAYRTEVRLIMEVQNPSVKRFLARELGYPAQHVEVIAATKTLIGTDEERSAFQVQTLRTLREYQQHVARLHAELTEKVQLDGTSPEFLAFAESFVPRLRGVRDDLATWEKTRVVWFDAGLFSALGQAFFQLDWAVEQQKIGELESVQSDLGNVAADLRRMKDGIDSRLPVEPGSQGSSESEGSR